MNKFLVLAIFFTLTSLYSADPNPNPLIPNASYYTVEEDYFEQEKDYFVNFYSSTGDLLVRKKQKGFIYDEHKKLDPAALKPQPTAFAISNYTHTKVPEALYEVLFFDKHGNEIKLGFSCCYDRGSTSFKHFTPDELKKNLSTKNILIEGALKGWLELYSESVDLSQVLAIPYENTYCHARMNFIACLGNIELSDNNRGLKYQEIDMLLRKAEHTLCIPKYCINNSQSSLSKKYYTCLSNWIISNLQKDFNSIDACYHNLKNILNRMKREIPLPELIVEPELTKTIELWKKIYRSRPCAYKFA